MLKNLESTAPEVSIEGFIFCKFLYRGRPVCISYYDPATSKWSISENFEKPFREVGDTDEMERELKRIDSSLRVN